MIVLHALGGNAKLMEMMTGFSEKADKEGFIVVYPEAIGTSEGVLSSWNAGFCCGYAAKKNIDDVGSIRDLLDYLTSNYSIDPKRIFVTGVSNGGMMAYRLGAELSDTIAAIGVVSGAIGTMSSGAGLPNMIAEPQNPVPVIIFHGKKDRLIPYEGRRPDKALRGPFFLPVKDAVDFWVKNNGCSVEFKRDFVAESAVRTSYRDCQSGADVILYTIEDGGHAWPGGRVYLSRDKPSKEISATDLIWDFFKNHPKKRI